MDPLDRHLAYMKRMKKKMKGSSKFSIFFSLAFVLWLAIVAGLAVVAIHFISKYW